MPVLPLIDLLILLGWTSLFVAFAQKAIWITTHYRPILMGMTPMDFAILAGLLLVFALALAGRTWVKINEPQLLALRGKRVEEAARRRIHEAEVADLDAAASVTPIHAETAGADPR